MTPFDSLRSLRVTGALLFALLVPAFANAATGGKLPGEEIVGRADDEDPKAFLKRVKSDLLKVDASIDATKTLLSKSKDSLILPDVSLRLAELYVEKSRLLYYKAVEERSSKSGEAVAAPDSKYFKELAIELYKKILKDFPGYPQNDKIRFYLGHEYQELALTPEMLKEYSRLATDYPDSPLVPEALLITGNFYFEKRDMDTAETHYKKVLSKNDKGLAALARYKMGWIEMNRTNHKEALANFEQAARYANAGTMAATNASTAQRQKLKNVRREALTDSVQPFTEVKKPEDAVAYYGELADTRNLRAANAQPHGVVRRNPPVAAPLAAGTGLCALQHEPAARAGRSADAGVVGRIPAALFGEEQLDARAFGERDGPGKADPHGAAGYAEDFDDAGAALRGQIAFATDGER